MLNLYQTSARMSDHRLRQSADRLFRTVEARFVILEAKASSDAPEPSEQQSLL